MPTQLITDQPRNPVHWFVAKHWKWNQKSEYIEEFVAYRAHSYRRIGLEYRSGPSCPFALCSYSVHKEDYVAPFVHRVSFFRCHFATPQSAVEHLS